MALAPDTILQARYRIVRLLGQGGMGTVYEALDERLNAPVALKETFFSDERLRKQFEREAQLLARLHHPALPRVSDHFNEGDGQFLVMQFIAGDDLWEMLQKQGSAFPPDKVLIWADQLLDALDYLHSQDPPIIHRDIKPQNLKLTGRNQVILLDFGLAKGFAGQISRVTTSGSIFGYTPNYAPLEQIHGTGTDVRSDLYSLAATLYHLMTGKIPSDALSRASANITDQPDPLRLANEVNPAVSAEVANVLQQAMAQNPNKRFASAVKMREALDRASQRHTKPDTEAETVLLQTPTSSPIPLQSAEVQNAAPLEPTIAASPQQPRDQNPTVASGTIPSPVETSPIPSYRPALSNTFPQFPTPFPQPARKSKMVLWLIIGAIIVATSIITVAISYYSRSSISGNTADEEASNGSAARRGGKKETSESGGDTGGGAQTAQAWTPTGDEGSITGKINLTGTPPAPRSIDTAQDANCSAKNPNLMTETVVAKDGKLQNVIVYIKDGTLADGKKISDYSFKTPDTEVTLDQNGCHYVPHVIGMQTNQKLKVINSDQTNHNIHALPKPGGGNEEWNQSQGPGAAPLMGTFKRAEIVPIKCNQHPWMKAYVGVFKTPFYAVSKGDGSFEITGVPPGTYTLAAWQEKGPTERIMQVTVPVKGTATADFTFDAGAMASATGTSSLEMVPAFVLPMLVNELH